MQAFNILNIDYFKTFPVGDTAYIVLDRNRDFIANAASSYIYVIVSSKYLQTIPLVDDCPVNYSIIPFDILSSKLGRGLNKIESPSLDENDTFFLIA